MTLVLLAACGLALGSHGFAAGARFPVPALAAAILLAAIFGRRKFVPVSLWSLKHMGGRDAAPEQPVAANQLLFTHNASR